MANQARLTVSFKCTKCNFLITLDGNKDRISYVSKILIETHKTYFPKCKGKDTDFIIEAVDKNNVNTGAILAKRKEETKQILERENPHIDDIIGNKDAKEILKTRITDYLTYKSRLKEINKHLGCGIVLAGIQGTAKTNMMAAVVNDIIYLNPEYKSKFDIIIMKSHDFGGTLGQIAKTIETVLDEIRKSNRDNNKETVLLIDEIDALLPKRKTDRLTSKEKMSSILDEFGGLHDDHTILVIGTTNKPQDIDNEALVAGRFGNPILVNIPTDEERWELFCKFTKNIKLDEKITEKYVNEKLSKFSGRDVKYFTTDLHIIYYKKEPEVINCSDVENLLETKYKTTNKSNLESLYELAGYYSRYESNVRGLDIYVLPDNIEMKAEA